MDIAGLFGCGWLFLLRYVVDLFFFLCVNCLPYVSRVDLI